MTNWHQFKALKHSYVLPYAFTEHGVAMAASVLNSETAVKISIHIIKTFVRLREFIYKHQEIAYMLSLLEKKVNKHDLEIQQLMEAIHGLLRTPEKPKREIGFHAK